VSGEPTVVFAPAPTTRKMLDALGVALRVPGLTAVLIGGMGVACRLAQVHRATGDVDLVTEEGEDSPGALLVRAGIATPDPSFPDRVYVNDTKLELIGTSALPEPLLIDADDDRLFVLAHRWALDTGTTCHLLVEGGPRTSVAVASPAALVATKLSALRGRRRQDRKRASDAYDIFRLLDACDVDGAVSTALDSAPEDLARLIASGLRAAFVDEADRALLRMRTFGEPEWGAMTSDDLLAVVAPLLDHMGQS